MTGTDPTRGEPGSQVVPVKRSTEVSRIRLKTHAEVSETGGWPVTGTAQTATKMEAVLPDDIWPTG